MEMDIGCNHPRAREVTRILLNRKWKRINLHSENLNDFLLWKRMHMRCRSTNRVSNSYLSLKVLKSLKKKTNQNKNKNRMPLCSSSSTTVSILRRIISTCSSRRNKKVVTCSTSKLFKEMHTRMKDRMEYIKVGYALSNSRILKHYYQYGHDGGRKYGLLLYVCEGLRPAVEHEKYDADKALEYEVDSSFIYKLQSGLFIRPRVYSTSKPLFLTGIRSDHNNVVPIGMAAIIRLLGIPDSYGEAMLRDISCFAHEMNNTRHRFSLCVQFQIATLQRKNEHVLKTRLRSNVEGYCRLYDLIFLYRKEMDLQPLHIQEYAAFINSPNCMDMDVEERERDCCSICLEELRAGCSSYVLPCSHVHHYHCIFKLMSRTNLCPLCRHPYCRIFPAFKVYPLSRVLNLESS